LFQRDLVESAGGADKLRIKLRHASIPFASRWATAYTDGPLVSCVRGAKSSAKTRFARCRTIFSPPLDRCLAARLGPPPWWPESGARQLGISSACCSPSVATKWPQMLKHCSFQCYNSAWPMASFCSAADSSLPLGSGRSNRLRMGDILRPPACGRTWPDRELCLAKTGAVCGSSTPSGGSAQAGRKPNYPNFFPVFSQFSGFEGCIFTTVDFNHPVVGLFSIARIRVY
jgi:hypothetical protein